MMCRCVKYVVSLSSLVLVTTWCLVITVYRWRNWHLGRLSDLSSAKDIVSGRTLFVLLLTTVEAVSWNSGRLRHASSLPTCRPLGCKQGTYWVLEGTCVCTWVLCYLRGGDSSGKFSGVPKCGKNTFYFLCKI